MEVSRAVVFVVLLMLNCEDIHATPDRERSRDDHGDVSCPEAGDIFPCTCSIDADLNMDLNCSAVEDEEQLGQIMQSNFPSSNFRRLIIIQYPHLKSLKAGVLGNTTYQEFIISVESLEVVEGGALTGSSSTATLMDFSYSSINSFPFEELSLYTSLHTLNISYNNLKYFPNLTSVTLQKLNFIGNPMGLMPVTAFSNTPSLQIIFLTDVGLRDIDPGTFSDLPDLWFVHLGLNELSQIQEGAFQLTGYRESYVLLDNNNISSVASNAISGLTAGSGVGLWRNNMTVLEEEVWRPLLQEGVELDLPENPLVCGCDVAWIVLNPTFKNLISEFTTCSDGEHFMDLDPETFQHC